MNIFDIFLPTFYSLIPKVQFGIAPLVAAGVAKVGGAAAASGGGAAAGGGGLLAGGGAKLLGGLGGLLGKGKGKGKAGAGKGKGPGIGGLKGKLPGLGTGGKRLAAGALAAGQLIASQRAKKQARRAGPSLEDRNQRLLVDEVARERSAIKAGTDVATQSRIAELGRLGAASRQGIVRSTGGDVGATLSGLLRSQAATGQGVNRALGQSQQRLSGLTNLQANLTNTIAQRRLDIQQNRMTQQLAKAAQGGKEGFANLAALVATARNPTQASGAPAGAPGQGLSSIIQSGIGAAGQAGPESQPVPDAQQSLSQPFLTNETGQEVSNLV